jgi:hypothetical protein
MRLAASRKTSGPKSRPVGRHGYVQPERLRADIIVTILRHYLSGEGIDPEG